MSILTVKRDNDKVVIMVATDLANNCNGTQAASIPFTWKMEQVYTADLLWQYIENRIYGAVANIRLEAYNQGWKDAKAKNPKKHGDWFSGIL